MNPVDKILGDVKEIDRWMARHCEDCGGNKTRRDADLCFKCAKKKAKSFGKRLSQEEYDYGDI